MVTMYEIAEKAGVSQSTVSRVLNGSDKIKPETRKKVLNIAKKLNYELNITAQSLSKKKSYLIGIVLTDILNPFFAELLHYTEDNTYLNDYNLIVCVTEGNVQKEKDFLRMLRSRQVDGLLIAPTEKNIKHIESLQNQNIPVVSVTQEVKWFDSVMISHERGGEQVGRHLFERGYKNIGFIGLTSDEKFLGFEREMKKFGIDYNEKYHVEVHGWGVFNEKQVIKGLQDLIDKNIMNEVEAFFAASDIYALTAMNFLQENGYKVPDDIAIVGFDNTYLSYASNPKITSVAQPISEMSRLAVDLLLKRMENDVNISEKEKIELEPRLMVRESTMKKA